jgi:hypothetical protein
MLIGRLEIREVLGMMGTLAALSVAGSAVQRVDADLVEVRVKPSMEQPAPAALQPDRPQAPMLRIAPPSDTPGARLQEVRLERPEVVAPPLKCPPLGEGGVRGHLPNCREILV